MLSMNQIVQEDAVALRKLLLVVQKHFVVVQSEP
uniref:Large proline-rich protein bag6 isoform X1 n=1 Tax=Rhizophora mucronata TaxID=61149 RepID=A0A2P2KVN6_RHIMU